MEPNRDAQDPGDDPRGLTRAWAGWARRTVDPAATEASPSVGAAVATVRAGGSTEAGVVAASVATGVRPTPGDLAALDAERWRLRELLAELGRGPLPGDGAAVAAGLRTRLGVADRVAASVGTLGGWTAPPAWPPATAGAVPGDPRSGDSGDADQGVRILGATGAFLLVTATLLFEAFGVSRSAHLARFAVVVGVESVLVLAARACRRSDRFRAVSGAYLAAGALVLPVVLAAALTARPLGVVPRPAVGLAVGALLCAAVYAALAVELPSRAYGILSLAAVGIGWLAATGASGGGPGTGRFGPSTALLCCLYLAVDALAVRGSAGDVAVGGRDRTGRAFGGTSAGFAVGTGAVAALVAIVGRGDVDGWAPVLTLGLLAAGLFAAAWPAPRRGCLAPGSIAGSAAVLLMGPWLSWGRGGTAVALILLAVSALALEARLGSEPGVAGCLRALATVEALTMVLIPQGPSWWAPVALAAATAVPLRIVARTGRPGWAWASVPTAVAAWFYAAWLVATAFGVATTRAPGLLTAALMLAPLPVLLVGAGVACRARRSVWSHTAYAAAAVLGSVVVVLTSGGGALGWVSVELLVSWVVVFGVTAVEDATGPVPVGAAAGMFGAALAVRAVDRGAAAGAMLMAGLVVVIAEYGMGTVLRGAGAAPGPAVDRTGLATAHRTTSLGGAAGAAALALSSMAVVGSSGSLAALVAVAVTAVLLVAEARGAGGAWWLGTAAVLVASLATLPVAAAAGARDPQWYVVGPALALLVVGMHLPDDPRDPGGVVHGRWFAAAGAGVLLGTTFVQVLGGGRGGAGPVVLLVAEGATCVLAGVVAERRVPVIAGAVAVALGGMAALSLVPSTLALSLIIGFVAVSVLAAATLLVATRRRPTQLPDAGRWATWDRWR